MSAGNNRIFETYEKYYNELLRLAVGIMGNLPDAEDVMQDLGIAIIEKEEKFKVANNIRAFLRAAVINLSKDKYRKNKRESSIVLDLFPESNINITEKGLVSLEERELLEKILSNYSLKDRETFLRYFVEGYSVRELAIMLGVKEKALSQKLLRMRKKVAKEYLLFIIFLFIFR